MKNDNIKVVILGLGGVGKRILKELSTKDGLDIVGVIDSYDAIVGKDAGVVAGIDPIGVKISNDEDAVYKLSLIHICPVVHALYGVSTLCSEYWCWKI